MESLKHDIPAVLLHNEVGEFVSREHSIIVGIVPMKAAGNVIDLYWKSTENSLKNRSNVLIRELFRRTIAVFVNYADSLAADQSTQHVFRLLVLRETASCRMERAGHRGRH